MVLVGTRVFTRMETKSTLVIVLYGNKISVPKGYGEGEPFQVFVFGLKFSCHLDRN